MKLSISKILRMTGLACLMLLVRPAAGGMVESFEDINYWVGAGENSSALVLDWDGHGDQDFSLTWGFRWDGIATGEDMLQAILRADSRLFAKIGSFGNQIAAVSYTHLTLPTIYSV